MIRNEDRTPLLPVQEEVVASPVASTTPSTFSFVKPCVALSRAEIVWKVVASQPKDVTIVIENLSPTHNLGFKMMTTAPKRYLLKPNSAVVPKLGKQEVTITVNPLSDDDLAICGVFTDKFLVKSVGILEEATREQLIKIWEDPAASTCISNQKLPSIFDTTPVFSKIIPSLVFTTPSAFTSRFDFDWYPDEDEAAEPKVHEFVLSNISEEDGLMFQVKSASLALFTIEPSSGVLKPKESVTMTVGLSPDVKETKYFRIVCCGTHGVELETSQLTTELWNEAKSVTSDIDLTANVDACALVVIPKNELLWPVGETAPKPYTATLVLDNPSSNRFVPFKVMTTARNVIIAKPNKGVIEKKSSATITLTLSDLVDIADYKSSSHKMLVKSVSLEDEEEAKKEDFWNAPTIATTDRKIAIKFVEAAPATD